MNHRNAMLSFTLAAACALLWSCSGARQFTENERGKLSARMLNLSKAVDGYFSRLKTVPKESDAELLRKAAAHDPSLLAEKDFAPYQLQVQYQNPYAVLLLCTKDGKRALIEDAGCSARIDRQVLDNAPCAFRLKVKAGCQVEGADGPQQQK